MKTLGSAFQGIQQAISDELVNRLAPETAQNVIGRVFRDDNPTSNQYLKLFRKILNVTMISSTSALIRYEELSLYDAPGISVATKMLEYKTLSGWTEVDATSYATRRDEVLKVLADAQLPDSSIAACELCKTKITDAIRFGRYQLERVDLGLNSDNWQNHRDWVMTLFVNSLGTRAAVPDICTACGLRFISALVFELAQIPANAKVVQERFGWISRLYPPTVPDVVASPDTP